MPQRVDEHAAWRQRQLARDQPIGEPAHFQEARRQHGQQVGIDHRQRGGEELVHGERDVAAAIQTGQRLIDKTVRPSRKADQHMARGTESVEAEFDPGERMVAPHRADVATLRQSLMPQRCDIAQRDQRGHGFRKVSDREIDVALGQQIARVAVLQRPNAQVTADTGRLEACHQRRHQQGGHGIHHCHAENPVVRGRVVYGGFQRMTQLPQCIAHLRPQRLAKGRRPHASGSACEQVLTHRIAQALQSVADGRLRHRQLLGGTRDVALSHHGIEHPQQIQVERTEVHESQ